MLREGRRHRIASHHRSRRVHALRRGFAFLLGCPEAVFVSQSRRGRLVYLVCLLFYGKPCNSVCLPCFLFCFVKTTCTLFVYLAPLLWSLNYDQLIVVPCCVLFERGGAMREQVSHDQKHATVPITNARTNTKTSANQKATTRGLSGVSDNTDRRYPILPA